MVVIRRQDRAVADDARPDRGDGGCFGREGDLARIFELLAGEGTTVTLVGPPGVGKTRLANEVVRRGGAQDVIACELSEARNADDIIATFAERLGVALERGAPESLVDQVAEALAERGDVLVVLDNLEQLIDVAAGTFTKLRRAAPAARWLATSRQPLAIAGEWVHEVQPLSITSPDGSESDAARMLGDRVHRARGGPISDREREIFDRIAVQLDGLPLALELAAARIASLGAAVVEARLATQLAVLTRGPRDQRTLREAIAWSWALLAPAERTALAQLSMFRGGFDLDSAEAVIESGTPALDVVDALRHKSLLHVRSDDSGSLRFGIYLSIREFAFAELAPADAARVAERHAAHFAALVERTTDLARLSVERDNLFAAIERSITAGTPLAMTVAARLLVGLAPLVDRAPLEPYLERLESFLAAAASGDIDPSLRVGVQAAAARCMRRLGRVREARRLYADALAVARVLGNQSSEATLRSDLGMMAFFESRVDEALAQWSASIELYRAIGDDFQLGRTLVREGLALRETGLLARARERQLAALDLVERDPTDTVTVLSLTELAHIHIELGELDDAARVLADAATRSTSLLAEAAVISRRGFLCLARGDLDGASVFAARAQVAFRRAGYQRFEVGSTCYAGIIELARGDVASARRAFESAQPMLRHDPRGAHLCGAWLAHAMFVGGERDRALHRYESLPRLAPDDALRITSEILRLPLGGGDDLAGRARELAGTIISGTGLPAEASSFDVRLALAALDRLGRAAEPARAPGLRVEANGAAFELADERFSLAKHRTLGRIMLALVEKRLSAPGDALPWQAVFEAGWPQDRAHSEAARNRVKVAVSTLRSLGLRDLVLHDGTGYLLDPETPVHIVGASVT